MAHRSNVGGVQRSSTVSLRAGPGFGALVGVLAAIALAAGTVVSSLAAEPGQLDDAEVLIPIASAETSLSCWSHVRFPADALDGPGGAQDRAGPMYRALRKGIAEGVGDVPGIRKMDWRLVARDAIDAVFLAPGGPFGWTELAVTREWGEWEPVGISGCKLMVVLGPDVGPAVWALDPAYPTPGAADTTLHLLAWEVDCSSGIATTGRNVGPLVQYDADAVVLTLGVRPIPGPKLCPMPSGTPVTVTLAEPLGERTLLDGALVPPAIPVSPLGPPDVVPASPDPEASPAASAAAAPLPAPWES